MDCSHFTENEIIKKMIVNPNFFECIILKYESPLKKYIYRRSGFSQSQIEDVLQEVFLLVYKNINEYRHELAFKNWIYRIAHNKTIDCLRRAGRNSTSSPSLTVDDVEVNPFLEFLNSTSPENQILVQSDLAWLVAAIKTLSPKEQEALILRFWEDKDYEEISDILKIPLGSVGSRINRARSNLLKLKRQEES